VGGGCQDEKTSASASGGADASFGEREGEATCQSMPMAGSFQSRLRSLGWCQSVVHL